MAIKSGSKVRFKSPKPYDWIGYWYDDAEGKTGTYHAGREYVELDEPTPNTAGDERGEFGPGWYADEDWLEVVAEPGLGFVATITIRMHEEATLAAAAEQVEAWVSVIVDDLVIGCGESVNYVVTDGEENMSSGSLPR